MEKIVKAAIQNNVVLIPYGGGTNVTLCLQLSKEEKRMIISLDMSRVFNILNK